MAKRERLSSRDATGHSDKTLEGMINPQEEAYRARKGFGLSGYGEDFEGKT